MVPLSVKTVAIIVAHPDDETLWSGGSILSHPEWKCFVACLSRKSDEERAAKFFKALQVLNAKGVIADLPDEPDQHRLEQEKIREKITEILPSEHFDLMITHNPSGEYTRHIRHEEISKAVINMWNAGSLSATELLTFAFSDSQKKHYPLASIDAPVYQILKRNIWLKKYSIITDVYGFGIHSWEAETTPKSEAFWQFNNPQEAKKWLEQVGSLPG